MSFNVFWIIPTGNYPVPKAFLKMTFFFPKDVGSLDDISTDIVNHDE